MKTSYTKEELVRRIRWYINLRLFVVLTVGITGTLPQFFQEGYVPQVRANISILLAILAINGIFWLMCNLKSLTYRVFHILAIAQLVLDIVIVTGVVYSNGGIENIVVGLYAVPIIMSGALLGRWAIYLTGASASIIYDLLIGLDYLHVISPLSILAPSLHTNTNYVVETLFFAPAMLMTMTVLTDFMANLIRERTRLATKLDIVTEQRAELEAIIETMGSALVSVNQAGKITLVNDAFERLTDWDKNEILNKDLDEILPLLDEHGKKVSKAKRPLMRLLGIRQPGAGANVELVSRYYYPKKNGGIFPFVGSVSPIRLRGKTIGATTVFEDATSIKQIDQLKTNFMALASHQLKTPINEIRGYVDNMLNGVTGSLNEKQLEYLKNIGDIALRCNKLITDLLDSAVLEQGSIRLSIEPVSLSEVIAQVKTIYEDRMKQKSLKFKVTRPAADVIVAADKDVLIEIVGNVVANAVNYSNQGTDVTLRYDKDNVHGLVFVTDIGRVMEKKVIDSLFQKNDILSSAPKAEGGTGVGLYLAKQLIALQKGEISVLESTDKGTTICIKIPLRRTS